MTTAETSPAKMNGDKQQNFVERVANIPLVSDGLAQVHAVIQSNSYSSAAYSKAEGVATEILKRSEPYQQKYADHIQSLDSAANKSLDYVQSKVPYPFEVKSDQLLADARKPADQAYGVAVSYQTSLSERVRGQIESTQAALQNLQERFSSLLHNKSGAAQKEGEDLKADAESKSAGLSERVHGYAASVLGEIDALKNNIAKQRSELPQQVSTAVQPLLDTLTKGAADIREELAKKDVPMTTKAQNILHHTREITTPLIQDTLDILRNLLNRAKVEGKEKSENLNGKLEEVEDLVNGKIEEVKTNGAHH